MANNCVCGLNSNGSSQLFSGATRIVSARVDENGRLILVGADGSVVTSTTSDCCCCTLASKNYALSVAQNNAALGLVTLATENGTIAAGTLQTTPVTPSNTTVDVTTALITTTVAVRDIEYLAFAALPSDELIPTLNCDSSIAAPQCPTNIAIEARLREIFGDNVFPITVADIAAALTLITNTVAALAPTTIYGICNGILWAEVCGIFQAIPLCTINSISYTAPVTP